MRRTALIGLLLALPGCTGFGEFLAHTTSPPPANPNLPMADSENVRELVHRVRRKLASVAADDLIESKRGVGYRLAGEPG